MKNQIFKYLVFVFGTLLFFGCQSSPPKPELRGTGPLAVQINDKVVGVPEYHNPLEIWRVRHMNEINDGNFREQDCFICHRANTSCNNCHDYVGVRRVNEPFLPKGFDPEKNRLQTFETKKKVKGVNNG